MVAVQGAAGQGDGPAPVLVNTVIICNTVIRVCIATYLHVEVLRGGPEGVRGEAGGRPVLRQPLPPPLPGRLHAHRGPVRVISRGLTVQKYLLISKNISSSIRTWTHCCSSAMSALRDLSCVLSGARRRLASLIPVLLYLFLFQPPCRQNF